MLIGYQNPVNSAIIRSRCKKSTGNERRTVTSAVIAGNTMKYDQPFAMALALTMQTARQPTMKAICK